MSAARLWRRANAVANCRCVTGLGRASQEPAVYWASEFEFWNTTTAGHLIAASLLLDGLGCGDVP